MTKTLLKALVVTLCMAGSAVALSACESTGDQSGENAAPYSSDRTAGNSGAVSGGSERSFRRAQSK